MAGMRIKRIKRTHKITFRVNGKKLSAFKGETILAALIVNGFKTLGQSVNYHEPRGALCGMGVCHECLVTVNDCRNVRSCMTEVEDGMEVEIDGL